MDRYIIITFPLQLYLAFLKDLFFSVSLLGNRQID